ncbi:potassium voltage-gated channel subfamily C member 3-like [Saccostrea echinata]|uniref:potassium voltage-gated channel subfamily C member 3-like n=1 Tax=Saccostrea echinata TaxID=191078 RepID=UPI002A83C833|nr:potassium voltage-gated channel subfamily C member 3-like [Saccostrea echinata]
METVKINVGGSVFETSAVTLSRYPNTLFGRLTKQSKFYDSTRKSYFFDKNPNVFLSILDLYRTGTLHFPSFYCSTVIKQELDFWELSPNMLSDCCLQQYIQSEADIQTTQKLRQTFEEYELDYTEEECRTSQVKRILRKIWLTLEEPSSSRLAKVFNYIFLVFVIISMVTFVLGSHPPFREEKLSYDRLSFVIANRSIRFFKELNLQNPKEVMLGTSLPNEALRHCEIFTSVFFTVELIFHFISCPRRLKYFRLPLNIIDLLLVVAMWVTFILEKDLGFLVKHYEVVQFYLVSRSLIVLRLFRVFRLMKLYSGLRIMMMSIRASFEDLLLLSLTFLIASLFFASFIYYAEFYVADTFSDIFIGIWWSVITMTTVGYGDTFPKSTFGYIVGGACAFSGMLILAMPVAILTTNFSDLYHKNKLQQMKKALVNKKKQSCSQSTLTELRCTSNSRQWEPFSYQDM